MGSEAAVRPNGTIKVTVMNDGRQVSRMVDGVWSTFEASHAGALPKGVYYVTGAKVPGKMVHPQNFRGPILYVEKKRYAYQWATELNGQSGMVRHPIEIFENAAKLTHTTKTATTADAKSAVVAGQYCEIAYQAGVGTLKIN